MSDEAARDVGEYLQAARRSLREGRLDSAASNCLAILQSSPENREALHVLGLTRFRQGLTTDAVDLLEKAVAAEPGFAPTQNDLGAMLLASGRSQQAIAVLERALQLQPGYADAHVNLGNAMHRLGMIGQAEEHYRTALNLNEGHARGWISLGNLLRTTRRSEEAVSCFQTAHKLAPNEPIVHNFLGAAYRDLRRMPEAVAEFERALQLNPELPEANANLGGALMGRSAYRDALPFLDKADTRQSAGSALECLLHLGEYEEIFRRIGAIAAHDRRNLHVASVSAYAAQQLQREDPYPFCPNPLSYVRIVEQPGGSVLDAAFLQSLIDDAKRLESVWEPRGISTRKGYQTAPTLFRNPTPALARLEEIIREEARHYRTSFGDVSIPLLGEWPENTIVNGWFVRLVQQGHQHTHNHPDGWLSGVLYLSLPAASPPPAGAIEFSLRGESYPEISGVHPTLQHMPEPGQLVQFPSSLFHRTIPFDGDDERLCIAFDIAPA